MIPTTKILPNPLKTRKTTLIMNSNARRGLVLTGKRGQHDYRYYWIYIISDCTDMKDVHRSATFGTLTFMEGRVADNMPFLLMVFTEDDFVSIFLTLSTKITLFL